MDRTTNVGLGLDCVRLARIMTSRANFLFPAIYCARRKVLNISSGTYPRWIEKIIIINENASFFSHVSRIVLLILMYSVLIHGR